MDDEIIWDAPTPPPKDWKDRHKAGEGMGDQEAHKRSVSDDINHRRITDEMESDYLEGVHEMENAAANPLDMHGATAQTHHRTEKYTGNAIFDYQLIPDYSEYDNTKAID